MTPDQRGAASVTLDTIIANALAEFWNLTPEDDPQMAQRSARAVTDALLTKGEQWWRNPVLDRDYLYATDMPDFQRVLVIPLDGAS